MVCRDNVEWDAEQELHARTSVGKNSDVTLSDEQLNKFENEADKFWDSFYDVHQNRYVKYLFFAKTNCNLGDKVFQRSPLVVYGIP